MELQELHSYIQEHQPNICQLSVLRDGNEIYSAEWNSYQRTDCVHSGSILSLFGVALAFRNIAAACLVIFCCLICYSARIRVEEKALEAQFGKEYADYKRSTYRLFPYIF